jgi:hypothetical protein
VVDFFRRLLVAGLPGYRPRGGSLEECPDRSGHLSRGPPSRVIRRSCRCAGASRVAVALGPAGASAACPGRQVGARSLSLRRPLTAPSCWVVSGTELERR